MTKWLSRSAALVAAVVLECAFVPLASAQEGRRADYVPAAVDQQRPVVATNGMVVAQERRGAEIGRDILARGGNAVDAAVATGFALAVTYPRAGNLGGGGFMTIYNAERGGGIPIYYRKTAPAAAQRRVMLGGARPPAP